MQNSKSNKDSRNGGRQYVVPGNSWFEGELTVPPRIALIHYKNLSDKTEIVEIYEKPRTTIIKIRKLSKQMKTNHSIGG